MHLLEEFLQIGTPFVPYPGFRKQAAAIASLENPDTEINIFAETHAGKSA